MKKKKAFVIKKEDKYLMDQGSVDSDAYSTDIYEAEIIETLEEAEDVLATSHIEGIEGEIIVPITISVVIDKEAVAAEIKEI